MDPERWQRVEALFHEALEREEPARTRFLDDQCASDPELRREVDRWLAADQAAPARLATAVGDAVRAFREVLAPGTRLGPYEIVGLKGEGGMGTVYRARRDDEVFRKDVAIKIVKREMASGDFLSRFRRERRILARLEHPYIARVLDGGSTEDGLPYLVMEYVEGQNLLEHATQQRLDLRGRVRLFCQVCEAVSYAHEHQVVHRDLKPGNILVDSDGRPRLLDFGIAKLATSDEPGARQDVTLTAGDFGMLTPRYASPEHVKGDPITVSSDVYSLGVILYELITGRMAHRLTGDSPGAILKAVCEDPVAPPSAAASTALADGEQVPIAPDVLEGDLDRIVLMALDKEPHRRYASVSALAEDIQRYLESLPVAARATTTGRRALRVVRQRRVALASVAIVAIAGAAYYVSRPSKQPAGEPPARKIMLAVLPLENLTGHQEHEYFIDGLHEEIVARLGRLHPQRLGVIARTSTLQYKSTKKSIATIGKELGSHYILEGSVRQAGNRLRVTVQLIQVSDQAHVLVETFERELDDLFSVQVEIGARVAERLSVDVLPEALATVEPHKQLSPEIHAAYLRGKHLYERRTLDPANLQRALDAFRTVVEAAPDFAEGHSALGRAYRYKAITAPPVERQALLDNARSELTKALSMNRKLASAHSALAGVRFVNDWDWVAAERSAREGVLLEPNSAGGHGSLALVLAHTRQHQEAEREIRLAEELSPLDPNIHEWAFFVHLAARRWERAQAAVRTLTDLAPTSTTHVYMTSLLLALRGDCPRAIVELAKVESRVDEPAATMDGYVPGYVFGRCGERGKVARRLKLMEKDPQNHAYTIAGVHAAAGNRLSAVRWLEESFRRREEHMSFVAVDPMLEPLRSEPRFEALLQKMSFPGS